MGGTQPRAADGRDPRPPRRPRAPGADTELHVRCRYTACTDIKPSTTAKPVRQANGQVVLTDVPDQIRTSHNAWCQHSSCYNHPVHERVIQRIMKIVDLHPNNAEHMQLLKCAAGAVRAARPTAACLHVGSRAQLLGPHC